MFKMSMTRITRCEKTDLDKIQNGENLSMLKGEQLIWIVLSGPTESR